MRFFVVVLFVINTLSVYSQNLNILHGDFTCFANGDESFCFFDDGAFHWKNGGHRSTGRYNVHNDSITFSFKEPEKNFDVQLNETRTNLTNGGHIEVRGIDVNGKPLKGLNVRLSFSNLQTTTDENGIAKINISDSIALAWKVDLIAIDNGKAKTRITGAKLSGIDRLIAVVWDDNLKYHDKQIVTYHFKRKGNTIFFDDTPYEIR